MNKPIENKTENKTRKISISGIILFIFSSMIVIGLWIWLWTSGMEKHEKTMAEYDAKTKQQITESELVREFVEDKSIVDVEYDHYRTSDADYDFTVTVEDSEGHSETKTFKGYCYKVLNSTDTYWHIDISDYGYITIHRPQIYTSK